MPTIALEMPDYAKAAKEQPRVSYLASLVRWLQLKKYQYEVTFSLYMLTSTEKFIFNLILFILVSLLVTAASLYLPDHVAVIYNRIWYYVHGGEIAYMNAASVAAAGEKTTLGQAIGESLKLTSGAIKAGAKATVREL
ncbi:hypothetical protein LTR84_002682 [Exophiala bonariae]|uniref:Uncharacterized protein n=1 Tax=Exophiala bonariae TaxID=1690606 RepID=A0AAV9N8N3_9EURO|nr:hypothetical protein LTR84_002682 [Exophiala bonariae]